MSAAMKLDEPEAHPAAMFFRMMEDDELKPIVEDMKRNGFDANHPILRYRGQILDGRNRLRAAAFAGVEPVFKDLSDDCDPYQESWKANGRRRDLTPSQKAAICDKMTTASLQWQAEREERIRKANEARAEKARAQHAISNPRAGETSGRSSSEDRTVKPDNRTVTALAREAGVSRSTIERVQKLKKEDPEQFEALARGDAPKKQRKKPAPRIDRQARSMDVLRLHNAGRGTAEIARELKLNPTSVSKVKADLGIAENSAPLKLWTDIDHVATRLEGAALQIEQLTTQLMGAEHLTADEEEIRRCIKSLSQSAQTVSRLRNALKQRLR